MDIALSILNADNLRTLVMLVALVSGFIWLDSRFDKKMDGKLDDFHVKLKTNDFAHLSETIRELTFILEKNGFLKTSDMAHINHNLDK
jgi:hypothetical protein